MKYSFYLIFILLFIIASCNNEEELTPPSTNDQAIVQTEATYQVTVIDGVTYAEGLSHQILNSPNATAIPLLLDVFLPQNNLDNRPAIVFIHGGGFIGGTRKDPNIVNMANYFASRGWVAFSIDYRLRGDFGTIPTEWIAYAQNNFDQNTIPAFLSLYPAHRDAKAALRWVIANAETYNINPDYLTVGGGSAGAITSITLGITNKEDYRDEISLSTDPTLATTNINQFYKVRTILDFWGSKIAVDALEDIYQHQRFDVTDAPIFIAHGTEDATVEFFNAQDLKSAYINTGVDYQFYELDGLGHGAWNATVNSKRLEELAFEFIVRQQELVIE